MVQHDHWNPQLISLTSEIDKRIPSTSNNQFFILWFDYKYDHTINIHQYMYSSLYTHICNKANRNFTCTSFVNWG